VVFPWAIDHDWKPEGSRSLNLRIGCCAAAIFGHYQADGLTAKHLKFIVEMKGPRCSSFELVGNFSFGSSMARTRNHAPSQLENVPRSCRPIERNTRLHLWFTIDAAACTLGTAHQQSCSFGSHGGRSNATSGTFKVLQANSALPPIFEAKGCGIDDRRDIFIDQIRDQSGNPTKSATRTIPAGSRGWLTRPARDEITVKFAPGAKCAASSDGSLVPPKSEFARGDFESGL
jgi:hypothetical protein